MKRSIPIQLNRRPRSKYRAVTTVVDGIRFDSKKEARRYSELRALEKTGEIEALGVHVIWPLVVNGHRCGDYECDFQYLCNPQRRFVIEDVKGVKTAVYRLKKKLVKAIYGFEIQEV